MTLHVGDSGDARAGCMVWLLLIVSEVAIAQTADAPILKVGDRWQFVVYYTVPSTTPNRTWIINAVSATRIDGTEDGEPLVLTKDGNVLESSRHKDSNPKALEFPLYVGKRWRYITDWVFKPKGSKGRSDVAIAVEAYEKVTVPAGEFDAFRLAARERLSGTSPLNSVYAGETTRMYWYAPGARAIVKTVSHNPYLGPSTIQLVAFELQA